jgi:hypothetical protein
MSSAQPSSSQRRNVRSRRNSTANDATSAGQKSNRETPSSRTNGGGQEKSKVNENSQEEKPNENRKGRFEASLNNRLDKNECNSTMCGKSCLWMA